MNLDALERKLLFDIEEAYNAATAERVSSIQNAVGDIVAHYAKNKLALLGLASLADVKDFGQHAVSEKMPTLIKAGYCLHKRNPSLSVRIPLVLDIKKANGLNVICPKGDLGKASDLIQHMALRYILSLPEELLNVSLFDPVGSGSAFSFLLALNKVKGNLYANEADIAAKLIEIVHGFANLQSDKLTYPYNNVEDYNAANTEKIPYRLLLLANYPEGFYYRRESQQALKKIIETGVKYGVIVLMTTDADLLASQQSIPGIGIDNLMGKIKIGQGLTTRLEQFEEAIHVMANYTLALETHLPANASDIVQYLNKRKADYDEQKAKASEKSLSFESFYEESKTPAKFWQGDSTDYVAFPLGFAIDHQPQPLDEGGFYLGNYNRQGNYHCLIGGETGSGKSVLINNLIINASYLYSPEELQFFIIDMKGNEYPEFMDLPHVKVLFQDSLKIDVALNVLEFVKKQYDDRVQLFRKHRVNEFTQYRAIGKLPRIVCVIDEFQTFNQSTDSEVKRKSAEVIDLLVGKGRSYGIHLILASQSLANASINQASMTNINVRLVLRLDDNASKQILSIGNNATLKFPDLQLVYNNTRGYEKQDNKVIKLPYLKGDLIKPHVAYLNSKLTLQTNYSAQKYLLPGNPEVYLDDNADVEKALVAGQVGTSRIYLGAPYLIKPDDSYMELLPEMENNILIAGQDLDTAYRLMFLIVTQFLACNNHNRAYYIQYTPKTGKHFNRFTPLAGLFENYTEHESARAEEVLESIQQEIERRKSLSVIESQALLILPQVNADPGMNTRNFAVANRIKSILETGPAMGVFTLLYTESYNSVYEITTFVNLCKYRLAVTGGVSEKILKNKLEVDEDGFAYLSAPAPYTLINPELIHVYNSYKTGFDSSVPAQIKSVITGLFEEV